jgi:hypothetical protein
MLVVIRKQNPIESTPRFKSEFLACRDESNGFTHMLDQAQNLKVIGPDTGSFGNL